MRRNAVALAFLLFLGQLFIVAAPAEPALAEGGSVVRHGHEYANLPLTAPRPHNHQAAQVPQAQVPMDVPPVAKPALPLRYVIAFAHRLHRTPDGIRWTPQRDRSPPSGL
ncbi:hypothetical protein [Lentzea fradiae]|nr:hypothetical protein [Lentzea fradiae]